jgi:hypothetical protein
MEPSDYDTVAFERWDEAFSAAAEADGFAALLEVSGFDAESLTDPDEAGAACLAAQVSTIEMLVPSLGDDAASVRQAIDRFLGNQRHEHLQSGSQARYSVRLVGPHSPVIHVDLLQEMDLEELREALLYSMVEITSNGNPIGPEEAKSLAEEVEGDLMFGGGSVNVHPRRFNGWLELEIEWLDGWF